MAKILVTGATGFIGNYVVQQLLNNNCQVIATSVSEAKARSFSWFSQIKYIPFSTDTFDNTIDYYKFFDSPDLIIHLAWKGLPNYKSLFHFEDNLPKQYNFLKNLLLNGAKDITVTGTCFEYGMKEGLLSEDIVTNPANAYAIAKDTLRKFIQELQKIHSFQFKWIRLFYTYGTGQNSNSLLSQLDKAIDSGDDVFNMSGGEQVRDYLPVEKVAEYIAHIALQNKVTGIINCCSSNPVSIKQFVEDYLDGKFLNIKLNLGYYPYTDYEPMAFWGDNKKLKTILNNERSN